MTVASLSAPSVAVANDRTVSRHKPSVKVIRSNHEMVIGANARHSESQRVTTLEQTDLGSTFQWRSGSRQLRSRWSLERTELRHLLLFERPLLRFSDFSQ